MKPHLLNHIIWKYTAHRNPALLIFTISGIWYGEKWGWHIHCCCYCRYSSYYYCHLLDKKSQGIMRCKNGITKVKNPNKEQFLKIPTMCICSLKIYSKSTASQVPALVGIYNQCILKGQANESLLYLQLWYSRLFLLHWPLNTFCS